MGRYFIKDKVFYKTLISLALPVVLQSAITMGVNIMATFMLGSYGEIQISASALAHDFIGIFMFITLGVGGGSAVLTAQYWGRGDNESLKKIMAIMLRLILAVACLFSIAAIIAPRQIMSAYTKDAAVIEEGITFLLISVPTFLLLGVSMTLTAVLRSVREVKLPLLISCVSFVINIFLSWVFIFGNLGAPEMKAAGAALATVVTRFVETAIMGIYVLKLDKKIGFKLKDLLVSTKGYVKPFAKYCLPVVGSDLLFGFGNTAITVIIGHTSTEFVAANAIIFTVVRLTLIMTSGVANAGGIMTGNTLGSGDVERTYKGGVTFLCISGLLGLIAAITVVSICPWVISKYNITEQTVAIAKSLMRAVGIMTVFGSVENALTKGILRGGGDTRFLLLADVLFMWVVSIPLGALVALVWNAPPFWIYVSMRVDWIIKTFWCIGRLVSRKWIHIVEAPKGEVAAGPVALASGEMDN